MGVIERQSIKRTIVSYFGVFLGFFATLYIYPLEWELYGSIQYWLSAATLLAPFLRMGSTSLISKYFPYFKKNGIKGFLGFILAVTTATVIVMTVILFILLWVVEQTANYSLFERNTLYIYILAVLIVFYTVFQFQSANIRRIVIPEIISKLGLKFVVIGIVLFSYLNILNENWSLPIIIAFHVLSLITIFFYLKSIGGFDFANVKQIKIPKHMRKSMFYFWAFGGLNFLGTLLAYKIDVLMIGTFMNKVSVGYYSIFLFISNLMFIPLTSVNQISAPIISENFEHGRINNIGAIYKKSSNNLFAFGAIIFLVVWINIYFVLGIMSKGEDLVPFVWILLFLGIAKILDLITSVNNLIMVYSKWYNYNLVFLFLTSILNCYLNIVFMDLYGIIGVGVATSISILIFNSLKTIFIYYKFNIHPFSKQTLIILITLILGMLVATFFQKIYIINNFISLCVYTTLTLLLFGSFFYYQKVSPELNQMLTKLFKFIKKRSV